LQRAKERIKLAGGIRQKLVNQRQVIAPASSKW
jgi:hypothetical protein